VGMVLEARLGEALGVTRAGTAARLAETLARFELGALPGSGVDEAAVPGFLGADKKARRGRPRFVLLERVGAVDGTKGWSREVPDAAVAELLAEAFGGGAAADRVTS
jgi:3-dehydroquinate synthetase